MADRPVTTGVHEEPEHSDLEWILRAKAGDHAAYAGLVRRYQDKVHRFLWRMVGSRDEALDLTQDTFIKAWQALPEWQPQAAFHTWLYRKKMPPLPRVSKAEEAAIRAADEASSGEPAEPIEQSAPKRSGRSGS